MQDLENERRADKTKIRAMCPYCQKYHIAELDYPFTGRGMPRLYHPRCLAIINSQYSIDTNDDNIDDTYDVTEFEFEQSQFYKLKSLEGESLIEC